MDAARLLLWALVFLSVPASSQAPPQSLEGFLAAAGELEKRQEYSGAERIYVEGLKVFPNQPELLKRLGIIYQTELKFQESIDAFRRIQQLRPNYVEVNFYLGLSYFGLNQLEQAIAAFQEELKVNPEYRRAHYYAAVALQSLDRKSEASQHLETLVQADPKDTKAWYQLARLHRSMAMQAFKQVVLLDPDSASFHALKAESYAEDEKYSEAIREYQEVLKKDPNFPGAHFGLGEIYYQTTNPEAERELHLALQEDPNQPVANYYVAEILLRAQKAAEALPLLQLAVRGDPKLAMAQFQLGKCYLALGDFEKALEALMKAVALDPKAKETHYQLAQVYGRLKSDEKRNHHLAIFEELTREEKERSLRKAERVLKDEKR
jgi:tetratricopeptide (TPR) repeat protein